MENDEDDIIVYNSPSPTSLLGQKNFNFPSPTSISQGKFNFPTELRNRNPKNGYSPTSVAKRRKKHKKTIGISRENLIGIALSVVFSFIYAITIALIIYYVFPWFYGHLFSLIREFIGWYRKYFTVVKKSVRAAKNIFELQANMTLPIFLNQFYKVKPCLFLSRNDKQKRETIVNYMTSKFKNHKLCIRETSIHSSGTNKCSDYITMRQWKRAIFASVNDTIITYSSSSRVNEHFNFFVTDDVVLKKLPKRNDFPSWRPALPTIDIFGDAKGDIPLIHQSYLDTSSNVPFADIPHSKKATLTLSFGSNSYSNTSAFSGTSFHVQNSHCSELIFGRKQWFLYKPGSFPALGFNPTHNLNEWIINILPKLKTSEMPYQVIQEEGEIFYVPSGWYHATRTLTAESLSVSEVSNERDYDSDSFLQYLQKASQLITAKDFLGAIKSLRIGLALTLDFQLLSKLGEAYEAIGEFGEANTMYKKSINANMLHPTAYVKALNLLASEKLVDVDGEVELKMILSQLDNLGLKSQVLSLL